MTPAPESSTQPATIVIVDDEESVRTAMARMVRSAGLRALIFASVDDLLQHLDVLTNACIISDIRMPGTSGLALPGLLAERGLDLPVIFVTAYDTSQLRTAAKRAGGAAYFRKPVDDHALLDAIEWVLRDPDDRSLDVAK